jgi:AcrR family transcriptional regulator
MSKQLDARDQGKLPPGRHGIPRAAVASNQRARLLEAAAAALAERGYAELRVGEITYRAGVSRATFYQQFRNKHDCVLAAQDEAYDRLNEAIATACADAADWPTGVAAAIGAGLDFAAEAPEQARLVLAAHHIASDPGLARHGLQAHTNLAEVFRSGRQDHPDANEALALTDQALLGALMSVVGARLLAGEAGSLAELKPDLIRMVLTPYVGDDEARRAASAQSPGD